MAAVVKGIGATVSVQLASRVLTFGATLRIAQIVSPTEYGIAFVSFQLFSNLALFFTKECFHKVALRSAGKDEANALRSAQNLGWLGFGMALVAVVPLSVSWIQQPPGHAPSTYALSVMLLAIASVLEAAAQPSLIACLRRGEYTERATGEASAMLIRTFSMLLIVMRSADMVLAFSAAQLLYSIVWLGWFANLQRRAQLPFPSFCSNGLHQDHQSALWQFLWSTALKLLLTEGEKLLLLVLFTESQWGVFGLISNLGSTVLRLIFAPTEEIAYAAFGSSANRPLHEQWRLLRALLMLQGGVGWLGLCFGPSFSWIAVRLLHGEHWATGEAPAVLSSYCMLLFVLALNGILDAYFSASAPADWLRRMRYVAAVSSAVLICASYLFQTGGPIALVWANTAATAVRVVACSAFVLTHSKLTPSYMELGPVLRMFGMIALAGVVCKILVTNVVSVTPGGAVPWMAMCGCIGVAGAMIIAIGWLFRADLRAIVKTARSREA